MAYEMVFGVWRDLDAEMERYQKRTEAICKAALALKAQEIDRVMARYELESDEFFTAQEKAGKLIQGYNKRKQR